MGQGRSYEACTALRRLCVLVSPSLPAYVRAVVPPRAASSKAPPTSLPSTHPPARLPQEDALRAGLLLEQAAHCLLALAQAHTRKFAFHLVLAGLRYDMAEQKGLAQRAYRCAEWVDGRRNGGCAAASSRTVATQKNVLPPSLTVSPLPQPLPLPCVAAAK